MSLCFSSVSSHVDHPDGGFSSSSFCPSPLSAAADDGTCAAVMPFTFSDGSMVLDPGQLSAPQDSTQPTPDRPPARTTKPRKPKPPQTEEERTAALDKRIEQIRAKHALKGTSPAQIDAAVRKAVQDAERFAKETPEQADARREKARLRLVDQTEEESAARREQNRLRQVQNRQDAAFREAEREQYTLSLHDALQI